MTRTPNLAASVLARLLNRAKETGDDYQTLLTSYSLERFLYRLAVSDLRDRFVLKGAMLLRLWEDQPYRATRDLDLLRRGDVQDRHVLLHQGRRGHGWRHLVPQGRERSGLLGHVGGRPGRQLHRLLVLTSDDLSVGG